MIRAGSLFLVLFLAAAAAIPRAHAAQVSLLDLTLTVDPTENRLQGAAEIVVIGRGETTFSLDTGLAIETVDRDGASITAIRKGNRITVPLGDKGIHRVRIAYRGVLSDRPLNAEGGILRSGWYPMPKTGVLHHRITVSTRAPFKGVAPGRLLEERTDGPIYRAQFETEAPGEPPVLFIGPYVIKQRLASGIRLRTYFHRELAPLADGYLDDTARYIARYAKEIGPYPFEGFSVVSGPHPVGYGFPGLTYMGRRVLKLPFIRKTSLGHEVLHCWWGNGVFIDTSQGNWAEGLTTFMADYAFAEDKGADAARTMRIHWLRDYAALPADRDRPARAFVGKSHDASQVVGYTKVAFFLHMLREEIGQDTFAAALRGFWRDNRFRAADWEDLRAAFESAAGRDLTAFFRQWLTRTGAPVLSLADAAYSNGALTLTIRQDGEPFSLTLPIRIDTALARTLHRVHIDGPETRVRIPVAAPPHSVTGDPDSDIFRRLAPGEAPPILRDIGLAKGVHGVIAYGAETEQKVAKVLISKLVDQPPRFTPPDSPLPDNTPFVIVGPGGKVKAYLDLLGIMAPPDEMAGQGTARVWTGRRGDQPYLAITAKNAAALTDLLRPLPHYRRSSWLVFDQGRVVRRGTWPILDGPLHLRM